MIWSIAWKNIWRNKIRSFVVIAALIIGIFGAVMLVGIMEGWVAQRTHDSIYKEISHIQVHHPEYLNNEELKYTVNNYHDIISTIANQPGVIAWSARTKMFCMAQSDWSSTGLIVKGVDPEKEKMVSELYQSLEEGDFLAETQRLPSIVLGEDAAKTLKLVNWEVTGEKLDSLDNTKFSRSFKQKLNDLKGKRFRVEKEFKDSLEANLSDKEYRKYSGYLAKYFSFYRLRSKITITLPDTSGQFIYCTFRVKGIFKTSNSMFDALNAFVDINVIKKNSGLSSDDYHEIAILCTDNETALTVNDELKQKIADNDLMSWKKISPELAMYSDFMKIMDYIYVAIFLLALSFGIINTMLMAVLERTKELGMLMAIGMNKLKLFKMIMLESVLLTFTGGIIGMIISSLSIHYFGKTGINLSMWAEGFEAMGYASIIYPSLSWDLFIGIIILVIITGILSAIWPARKALKLNPSEAIRNE